MNKITRTLVSLSLGCIVVGATITLLGGSFIPLKVMGSQILLFGGGIVVGLAGVAAGAK